MKTKRVFFFVKIIEIEKSGEFPILIGSILEKSGRVHLELFCPLRVGVKMQQGGRGCFDDLSIGLYY